MSEELKTVSTEISKESWKKLKIMALDKDISLPLLIKEILERVSKKKNIIDQNEGVS